VVSVWAAGPLLLQVERLRGLRCIWLSVSHGASSLAHYRPNNAFSMCPNRIGTIVVASRPMPEYTPTLVKTVKHQLQPYPDQTSIGIAEDV
jgi:hypothetical protein